VPVTAALHH